MAAFILIKRLVAPIAVLSTDSRDQSQSNMRGEPVSRILSRSTPLPAQSWAIIHLDGLLPGPSSCQPEPAGLKRPICGSYLALLPVGLAVPRLLPAARWALPHRFTITLHARLSLLCGAIPRVTPAGRYPAPLFHGVRTFLEGCPPRLPSPPRPALLRTPLRRVKPTVTGAARYCLGAQCFGLALGVSRGLYDGCCPFGVVWLMANSAVSALITCAFKCSSLGRRARRWVALREVG